MSANSRKPSSLSNTHAGSGQLRVMRLLPTLLIAVMLGGMTFAGCDDEKKEIIHVDNDPEKTPTIRTTDVSTLISDSGITRYKITTPLWLMFEEANEPYWKFPKGVHLEKFDPKLKPEAMVECDSAIYHKSKQLWQLDGYVNIHNTLGEKFLTNRLYWDQRQQKIYSDSFIHIERDGKIIEGYGFESNENMTQYNVLKVAGIFPAEKFTQPAARPDSVRPGVPASPPPPDAPLNPQHPNIIVSGQADESRIKGRRELKPIDDKEVQIERGALKKSLKQSSTPTPKSGKSPLSR